jgi:predicted ATPase
MLKTLNIKNFTVFPKADFSFGKNLNIIIGENGSGKSHILKVAYCAIAVSAKGAKDSLSDVPTKSFLAIAIADKLRNVFKPDELGRLATRRQGHANCVIKYTFNPSNLDLEFSFKTPSKKEVVIAKAPTGWAEKRPVFLPTRELLTISPGFVSLYETTHLSFEETWRDTCILLDAPLAKGPREHSIRELLVPIETAMGGNVILDKSGRFYLNVASGNMEMHLVAEGLRKLATIARLIATGSLLDKGYLFWDEPEANLNPKVIKTMAKTILQIANSGIQVFIATHSLFLLRELHILQQQEFVKLDARCFGLHIGVDGAVDVQQGKTMNDVGSISALDEDLQQSERYIDTELGVAPGKNNDASTGV